MGEQLRRLFKTYDIPAYFKPVNTLRQLLVHPNNIVDMQKMVEPMYHIQCDDDWEALYVEERERSMKAYFHKHRRQSSVNSDVSHHTNMDKLDYSVSLDNLNILTVENKMFEKSWRRQFTSMTWHLHLATMVGSSCFQQCGPICWETESGHHGLRTAKWGHSPHLTPQHH